VQWVVPSASDTWVTDKNTAYVEALAALGQSMDDISHNTTNDPGVAQMATQNYNKAVDAARQLAERLSPNSSGLDGTVQRLLQEPITQAHGLIPLPVDPAQKANGAAHNFCISAAPTLRKFPFQSSSEDARLDEFARLFAPGTGSVWKLEADEFAESVVKDGAQWKPKEGAKLQISQGWLNFLNRAQAVTDAFFPKGATQPQLLFTLRPKLDPAYQSVVLEIDGRAYEWKNSLQKQFSWPASPGGTGGGAVGRAVTGGVSIPFASEDGTWAVFRLMRDAEPRLPGSRIVEWKYLRSGVGRSEALSIPVRLEFVEFPGGADVFNAKFFDGLQCAGRAVQQVQ
jgi:type VI protein secretion system component VasK